MKNTALKFAGLVLLVVGAAGASFAALTAPEIDPAMGMNAVALLSGAALIVRARRK